VEALGPLAGMVPLLSAAESAAGTYAMLEGDTLAGLGFWDMSLGGGLYGVGSLSVFGCI